MNNVNTTEYIKFFMHDLMLAHLCPERKCKNPLVNLFIKEYPQDPAIETTRSCNRILYRMFPSTDLWEIIEEAENPGNYITGFFDYEIWGSNVERIMKELEESFMKS
ncbi:MAG: hypothetical protein ACM3SR_05795 [Ignavibacteriales bacterium]